MTGCWICLEPTARGDRYHADCLEKLFGYPRCPRIDLGATSLTEAIAEQSERISISGVQPKLVVDVDDEGSTLRREDNGRYILKPAVDRYKHLPQNEHLSMTLAGLAGVAVPRCGVLELPDGAAAYVVKRFDRSDTRPPSKRRQEDFCSLLQRDPADKYKSSAEECIKVVRLYSEQVDADLQRLFLQFLFAFWMSNEDLHLKNLSLGESPKGGYALSMAYDLVCSRLYPQLSKGMALPLNDRTLHHRRTDFLAFAGRCGMSDKEAAKAIDGLRGKRALAAQAVDRSLLPAPFRRAYQRELAKKDRALA
jgi:serine/threonine-protein kinase HipA